MSGELQIDGSYGEGGGQILRTSVSLSFLKNVPIRINNIRAGRPKPGLRAQHATGLELVNQVSNGVLSHCEVGSTEVAFMARDMVGGDKRLIEKDCGTAGAITLILQTILPCLTLDMSSPPSPPSS